MLHYLRAAAIGTFTILTIAWFLFAIAEFPWIVIADSNLTVVREMESRATAGGELAFVSFLAIFWAIAGISVPRALRGAVTILLLAAWLRLGLCIFPSAAIWELPARAIPFVLGTLALIGVFAADLSHAEEAEADEQGVPSTAYGVPSTK